MPERVSNIDLEKTADTKEVDVLKGKGGFIEFLTRHSKLRYITAVVLSCLSVGIFSSNTDTVLASENLTQTITSPDTEATPTPELSHSQSIHKMLLQTDSCYAQITDSIKGDTNVLKKLDASVTVINGKNMLPVDYAKEMGYSVTLNTARKTVTLDNGERKIVLTIGKKVMKITEDDTTTSVTMDANMQLDKNKDYVICIVAFGKAVDAPVQWDSVSKTIGINYTQTEFSKVKKVDATTELKYKALTNIAGGEFLDAQTFTNPVEKLSIGATVVYSSSKNKAAEKKLVTKYQSKLQKDDIIYCLGGKAYVVRKEACLAYDYKTIYYADIIYKLDSFNINDGSTQTACVKYINEYLKYKVVVDYQQKSLVMTDGVKVMSKYDAKTNQWTELDEYKLLGTPEQRIRKSLNKCLTGDGEAAVGSSSFYNPFGLDAKEVALYCETGDDSKCKTFKIMKNAKGEPAFIVNTSSKYGFTAENLEYIQQAVDRFNEIDETLIDTIANRYGLSCVSYDVAGGSSLAGIFNRNTGWAGSYKPEFFGNVVVINQNRKALMDQDKIRNRVSFAYGILVESRACYFRQMDGKGKEGFFNKPRVINEEADKYVYTIELCKKWLSEKAMTISEYNYWFSNAESALNAYDPSFILTWQWPDDKSMFVPEKSY